MILTAPHFLIVGSPRSGTTLVQRLATELPGVQVTPETHVFAVFYDRALRHRSFPIEGRDLEEVLHEYLATPAVDDIQLSVERVMTRLRGSCRDAWQFFSAVVTDLAPDAEVIGEKTPNHLRWWRPLTSSQPDLKLVGVLRDPRAVTASAKEAPFGMDSALLLGARWREDYWDLVTAARTLGPGRMLTLRYEDVVVNPRAAQSELASFLGVADLPTPIHEKGIELFPAWESSWKQQARGPIEVARTTAWRDELTTRERRQIEAITAPAMRGACYQPDERPGAALFARSLSPREWVSLARHQRSRRRQRRRIETTEV